MSGRFRQVMCRQVINDANVGEWTVCEYTIKPPTANGLSDWMTHGEGKEIGFSVENLHQVAFDSHVWDYGSRLQFYVMHENELSESFQENEKRKRVFKGLSQGDRLICIDAQDVMGLTEGKVYVFDCAGEEDGLVVVLDDKNEMKNYLFERFRVANRRQQ